MKEFNKVDKVFIKSNNTTNKIFNRYLYCLIPYLILSIVYNIITNTSSNIIDLIISLIITTMTCIFTQYIFNLTKKENNFIQIITEEGILTISIILSLYNFSSSIPIIIISSLITIIFKNILKNTIMSSSLYGIVFIIIANYFTISINTPLTNLKELSYIGTSEQILTPYGNVLKYTIGLNNIYLSPILAIISFIYLFIRKSIKYNIFISYILTFTFIMLTIGLFNDMSLWYPFFELTTGNILFLSIFCLVDYPNTPITTEGQVIYGIILGIITSILRFIIPELSVAITLILGTLLLTKIININSFKLKNNKKLYYTVITILLFLIITTSICINIII